MMKMAIAGVAFALLLGLAASVAPGQVLINEIYFDPPGSLDSYDEYIELRGAPNTSLANCYLIFLENENNQYNTGSPRHYRPYLRSGSLFHWQQRFSHHAAEE